MANGSTDWARSKARLAHRPRYRYGKPRSGVLVLHGHDLTPDPTPDTPDGIKAHAFPGPAGPEALGLTRFPAPAQAPRAPLRIKTHSVKTEILSSED